MNLYFCLLNIYELFGNYLRKHWEKHIFLPLGMGPYISPLQTLEKTLVPETFQKILLGIFLIITHHYMKHLEIHVWRSYALTSVILILHLHFFHGMFLPMCSSFSLLFIQRFKILYKKMFIFYKFGVIEFYGQCLKLHLPYVLR